MPRRFRYLRRIRVDRDRQLIILGSILAVICLVLSINLTIMLIKRSSNENKTSINNETTNSVSNITSTEILVILISEKSTTVAVQVTSSVTAVHQLEKFLNHTLSEPIRYESYGRSLGSTLYFTFPLVCQVNGFIATVSFRLFSPWMGNASLYVFIISASMTSYNILYRHSIDPQRNTTEWQTIDMPSNVLFIDQGSLVGIGMQEISSTNEIYAVKAAFSAIGLNINSNSSKFTVIIDRSLSVAFGYNVVYKSQKQHK